MPDLFLVLRIHPRSTLFPYTTLFRSMEEPIRVDQDGRVVPALATNASWPDEKTLELEVRPGVRFQDGEPDRKSTRLNSSHVAISYAVFCLKKKKRQTTAQTCGVEGSL